LPGMALRASPVQAPRIARRVCPRQTGNSPYPVLSAVRPLTVRHNFSNGESISHNWLSVIVI
jgi:hypothetical protein